MSRRLQAACRSWATLGALCCALAPAAARAGPEQEREDAGQRAAASPPLSDEDREVVENLDLLQAMDAAGDLDLLLELGKAEGDAPQQP